MRSAYPTSHDGESLLVQSLLLSGLLAVFLIACDNIISNTIDGPIDDPIDDLPDSVSDFNGVPSESAITVSWTNPEHNNITQFNLTWEDTNRSINSVVELAAPGTNTSSLVKVNYTITNLINGHDHTLSVSVIYENGQSVPSESLHRTPGVNTDGDEYPDTIDEDDDNDGINDLNPDGTPLDACARNATNWISNPITDHDSDGCKDEDEDRDDDNDGVNDFKADGTPLDACARNATDWISNQTTDYDGDGCKDEYEDSDDDNDGIPDFKGDGTTHRDNCQTKVNPKQANFDGDALGDACDPDDDNDGYEDDADADDNNNSLIDIRTLDELARMRDDLNGDGEDDGNIDTIDAIGNVGCPVTGCIGYELLRSLNFGNADSYVPGSRNMSLWTNGSGWTPIGSCPGGGSCLSRRYTRIFDGNHHNLSNLFIAAANNVRGIGLFGAINGTVRNLRLLAADISGGNTYVGTLAGYGGRNTRLENILVSGIAIETDAEEVGGIAGYLEESEAINTAVIHSNITGSSNVGGLFGQFQGRFTIPAGSPAGRRPWLNTSYALNNHVSGETHIGGLVGLSGNLDIDNSYAVGGRVSGTGGGISSVSGLIGHGQYGPGNFVWVENSYAALDSIVSPTLLRAGFVFPDLQALPFFNINNSYWNNDTMDIPANPRLPEQLWQRTTDQLQTPTNFTDSIYAAWANFWCKPGTSEVRESGTQPAAGFVRVWDLGNSAQYPAIRCTPGGVAIQRP